MPRNIEIKARIPDIEVIEPKIAALTDYGPIEMVQDDTFFGCEEGRLKLRVSSVDKSEVIFYRRAAQKGPKESFYVISQTNSPDSLRGTLSLAYGQTGRVRKRRTLYLAGRTRIHLDRVEDLGNFIELEVVMADGEPSEAGIAEAQRLIAVLGIASTQLIAEAYIDLLSRHDF
jgi:predicted adenylyl cyclase CyaB